MQMRASGGSSIEHATQEQHLHFHRHRRKEVTPQQAVGTAPWYVARTNVVEPLARFILAPATLSSPRITAVHGMGGSGKTESVRAVVQFPAVRRAFPGGVLWATLGQQPDLAALLGSWIQALGDRDFRSPNLDAASRHLTSLLKPRQTLLVIDDVWQRSHLEPFLVGGERCAVILTTRRANIAAGVGAQLFPLLGMSCAEAIKLAETIISAGQGGRLVGPARAAAERLFECFGYLPFAVQLAAFRVRFGMSWEDLEAAFEQELHRLEALDDPGADVDDKRLRAVLNLSLEALRKRDPALWRAFVELGVTPEDARLTPSSAANLWGWPIKQARERLLVLFDDALLVGAEGDQAGRRPQAFKVHDLLLDVCRSVLVDEPPLGLGLALPAAHELVLSRYQERLHQGQWHTIPQDGYAVGNLVRHMVAARRYEALYQLFRESTAEGQHGWSWTWETGGHAGGFQSDLNRAYMAAVKDYAATGRPAAVGMQFRYVLISASLNSLAGLIPVPMLLDLADRGVWPFGYALGKAVNYPNPVMQTEALAGLAWTVATDHLASVVQAVDGIRAPYGTTEVLLAAYRRVREADGLVTFESVRARLLAEPRGPERAAQMLELAELVQGARQTELLRAAAAEVQVEVGPLTTAEERRGAAADIRTHMHERLRYRFRPNIAERWRRMRHDSRGRGRLDQGDARAKTIDDRVQQLLCLAACLPFLNPGRARELAEGMLDQVRTRLTRDELRFAVSRMGPVLSDDSREELADWLLAQSDRATAVWCIAALIKQLKPPTARRIADAIIRKSPWLYGEALHLTAIDAFADYVSNSEHPRLIALASRRSLSPQDRAIARMRVAQVVEEPSKSRLIAAAKRDYMVVGDERFVGRHPTENEQLIRAARQQPDFDTWVETHSRIAFARDRGPNVRRLLSNADEGAVRLENWLAGLSQRATRVDAADGFARAWTDACTALAAEERPVALVGLALLAPLLSRLGGSEAVEEAVRAVDEAASWWP